MKQFILVLFISILTTGLYAQFTVDVAPADLNFSFEYDGSDPDYWNEWTEPVAHATLTNTSDETLTLKWEIEIIGGTDCPENWGYRVCDLNQCYSTNVNSNVMPDIGLNVPVPLAPGGSTIMDVHALPRFEPGCCVARLNYYDVTDPDNEIFVSSSDFTICVSLMPNAVSEVEKANLRVFPNPTANYISLSNNNFVEQLWVSNILGKRVRTFVTSPSDSYDLSDLPDGIYLVSMVEEDNKVIKTVRISKRNVRP